MHCRTEIQGWGGILTVFPSELLEFSFFLSLCLISSPFCVGPPFIMVHCQSEGTTSSRRNTPLTVKRSWLAKSIIIQLKTEFCNLKSGKHRRHSLWEVPRAIVQAFTCFVYSSKAVNRMGLTSWICSYEVLLVSAATFLSLQSKENAGLQRRGGLVFSVIEYAKKHAAVTVCNPL